MTAEGGTCQDTERNRPTDAHSQPGDGRGRHSSGHQKKQTDRCALTSWRRQRQALVRTMKVTDRPTRTHPLETAEGGTCQDTERNRPTDAHSPTGDGRGRDLSGHRRNRPTDVHSQTRDGRGMHLSGHEKKRTNQRALTSWIR